MVEKGGVKLKNMLVKKDPFQKPKCSTDIYLICHETEFSVPDEKNEHLVVPKMLDIDGSVLSANLHMRVNRLDKTLLEQ